LSDDYPPDKNDGFCLNVPMDDLLKKVDFSDPTTEVVIVLAVAAIAMLIFWLMQGDKGRA
jgi:hypothetical protein